MRHILPVLLVAAPVHAQDYNLPDLPFQTPDGAIACVIITGLENYVRCDIAGAEPSFTEPPEDCDLDWGFAFEVKPTGPGHLLCAGDTIADPSVQKMEPGFSHSRGGVACFSEPDGMTCLNAENRGFTLTLGKQSVF
ncbi:DUF6636 domain-containing protein [Pseudoruegeria sp. HB172150]|uniref:DUF6636 domain-containing protein n=1 Tax=Pseudoruegeria sp. HB172150 TaxID=2721164 RepID=UPI001554105C|nr:DUF6636 domain-containing protein [Pseudoruegeria sp. HB172150]